ncbi:coenzyme PQQ precursor peptide PqqA [Rhodoplanes tepidamans]|uniref:pyrroloquinoline quinone precursor peptide PqqA n=1 Tax=Rhodoplanes TaxID=29407 RepID=UPI002785C443|nr:coenzyme PQQ precursor peptide PqqA [Rhodoplanes tepidamans]
MPVTSATSPRRPGTSTGRRGFLSDRFDRERTVMPWTTPVLIEICLGLEINGYLPPEI